MVPVGPLHIGWAYSGMYNWDLPLLALCRSRPPSPCGLDVCGRQPFARSPVRLAGHSASAFPGGLSFMVRACVRCGRGVAAVGWLSWGARRTPVSSFLTSSNHERLLVRILCGGRRKWLGWPPRGSAAGGGASLGTVEMCICCAVSGWSASLNVVIPSPLFWAWNLGGTCIYEYFNFIGLVATYLFPTLGQS